MTIETNTELVEELPTSPGPQESVPEPKKNRTLHWDPDAKIEITGLQFDVIQKFGAFFEPLISTKVEIWKSMIEQGHVKDEDNNPISLKDLY